MPGVLSPGNLSLIGLLKNMAERSELTLLQRISLGNEGAKKSLEIDLEKLRYSVLQHLQDMFNTRQGDVPANDQYGLPDFNELDMSDGFEYAMEGIKKAIKKHIELYEPRLAGVRVHFVANVENPMDLMFEIKARLNIKGKISRVRFEASLNNDGALKVTT